MTKHWSRRYSERGPRQFLRPLSFRSLWPHLDRSTSLEQNERSKWEFVGVDEQESMFGVLLSISIDLLSRSVILVP